MANYYEILKCPIDAKHEELKEAYHKLVLEHHPDKKGLSGLEFFKIDQAWKILRDPMARRQYDQELRQKELEEQTYLFGSFSISEMRYNSSTQTYSHLCRCGGSYIFTTKDFEQFNSCLVGCDQCSLMASVDIKTP